MNHKDLVKSVNSGKTLIGVDRAMARKFYTDIPIKEIEKETDEAPYLDKIIVWLAFLLGPISLLISIVLGFWFFAWWGVGFLVFCPSIYFIYSSSSVRGGSRMIGINVLLLVMLYIYLFRITSTPEITGIIVMFIFSLWCARFVYCSSTYLLRMFIIRNEKAYYYLSKYLTIRSSG